MFVRLLCPSQVPFPEERPRFRQRYIEEKRREPIINTCTLCVPRAVVIRVVSCAMCATCCVNVWCRVQCMVCRVMYAMRVAETRIERTYTHADVTPFLPFCLPPFSSPLSSSFLSPPSSSFFLLLHPLGSHPRERHGGRRSYERWGRLHCVSSTATTGGAEGRGRGEGGEEGGGRGDEERHGGGRSTHHHRR